MREQVLISRRGKPIKEEKHVVHVLVYSSLLSF